MKRVKNAARDVFLKVVEKLHYRDTGGSDWSGEALRQAALRSGNALTFTCVPPGSGRRLALDRP